MPQFAQITDNFRSFIAQQKIFFVGTAARDALRHWAAQKGDSGIKAWWQAKNQVRLDGTLQ